MIDMESNKVRPDDLKWPKGAEGDDLIPCIVQDAGSGEVLMLAYQNRDSLRETMKTNVSTFYSRSRQELWRKGAVSGNLQHVRAMAADCDGDALLLRVVVEGPACHTGRRSCFFNTVQGGPAGPPFPGQTLSELEQLIESRRVHPKKASYTTALFRDDQARHKKIGEEATELVVASLSGTKKQIVGEAADLLYHTLVLLRAHGLSLSDVTQELASRKR
jgi:phosphoribosyl-ATP pyrophosphohydrolase/phosphoribosyl-AMP cyclohydrolase